jgi:hypothetical protein
MIDALESLNLTQESQSNAKEMSWDERRCFGSAQCAQKYVRCPRVGAKSRPPSIYRRTPSKRVVGLKSCMTDASVATRQMWHTGVRCSGSRQVSQTFEIQHSNSNRQTCLSRPSPASVVATDAVQLALARATVKPWATDSDVARLSLWRPRVCHARAESHG